MLSVSLTIRLRRACAHDVAAAYRLAMAEVRVRLPLGTCLSIFGMWESLVNPPASGAGDRRFESGHPDLSDVEFDTGVA